MACSNNNIHAQTHDRFLDVEDEPCKMLQPIEGFQNVPLVSLEEAIEPIIRFCPDIRRRVYIAKENCQNLSTNTLKVDEAASVYLYTMEWKPRRECLYMAMNTVLRHENRDEIEPWLLYLKLILTAFAQIPPNKMIIWRGVKKNLSYKYEVGKKYVWWAFSSCTESLDVLESELFLGTSGERTLFNINCDKGRRIASYSYISSENEIILLPATQFLVVGKLNPSPGLHIIQLQEIKPTFPLLELPLVSSVAPSTVSTNCNLKLKERIYRCLPDCMYIGELNVIDRDVPLIIKEAIIAQKCSFLDLNHNMITAEGARLIANVLTENTSLRNLRFWHNYLLDYGANYIVEALHSNSTLTWLCFASNGLTDACAPNIARMLQKNQSLETFYLDNNAIADEGMIMLMNSLHYNKTLRQLYLHNNTITDKSNHCIEKMFNDNGTLQLLSLGNNQFSKEGRTYLRNLKRQKNNLQIFL
jgi:hypothetical protein